ncbi:MAG: hypothetical protein Q9193_002744 [Seirophora villosa]
MSGYVQGHRLNAPETSEQRIDRLEQLATNLAELVAGLEERRAAEAAAAGIKFEMLSEQPNPSTSDQPQSSTSNKPRPSTAQLKNQVFNSEDNTLEQRIATMEAWVSSLVETTGNHIKQQIQGYEAAHAATALTLLAQSEPLVNQIKGDNSPETLVGCEMKEAPDTRKGMLPM